MTRTSRSSRSTPPCSSPTASRHAQAGAVEQLDERAVAERARRRRRSRPRSAARPRPRESVRGSVRVRRGQVELGGGVVAARAEQLQVAEEAARAPPSRRASRRRREPVGAQLGEVALEVVERSRSATGRPRNGSQRARGRGGRRRPCAARAARRAARGTPVDELGIGRHRPRVRAVVDAAEALARRRGCRSGSSRASSGRAAPGSRAGRRRPRAGASRTRGGAGAGAAVRRRSVRRVEPPAAGREEERVSRRRARARAAPSRR